MVYEYKFKLSVKAKKSTLKKLLKLRNKISSKR